MNIDINFNFYSDTPKGKDPDTYSETLRKYHQFLWSKSLPNGSIFNLDIKFFRMFKNIKDIFFYTVLKRSCFKIFSENELSVFKFTTNNSHLFINNSPTNIFSKKTTFPIDFI